MLQRTVLLTLATLSLPAVAQAATVSVKVCFDLEVKYGDAAVGDYWTTLTSVDAKGIKAKVTRSDGVVAWNGYTDGNGCTSSLSLSTTRSYSVVAYSEAVVAGNNTVVVYDDPTTPSTYSWTAASSFRPSASATKTYKWPLTASGSTYATNVLAMASRTVHFQNGGLKNDLFVVFHDGCPGGGGSCLKPTTIDSAHPSWPATYIHDKDSFGDRTKYVIAHEMGHLVGAMVDEHKRMANADSSADDATTTTLSTCANGSGHDMESEEWENSAVSEGWAHFYAAVMFNDRTDTDCQFFEWNPTDGPISCTEMEGWLPDECYGGSKSSAHTGNEGQWLAFWWRLYADEGYSFDTLAQAFGNADPRSWGSAKSGFDVYADLRSGAIAYGIDATAWDYWAAVTGVDQ